MDSSQSGIRVLLPLLPASCLRERSRALSEPLGPWSATENTGLSVWRSLWIIFWTVFIISFSVPVIVPTPKQYFPHESSCIPSPFRLRSSSLCRIFKPVVLWRLFIKLCSSHRRYCHVARYQDHRRKKHLPYFSSFPPLLTALLTFCFSKQTETPSCLLFSAFMIFLKQIIPRYHTTGCYHPGAKPGVFRVFPVSFFHFFSETIVQPSLLSGLQSHILFHP